MPVPITHLRNRCLPATIACLANFPACTVVECKPLSTNSLRVYLQQYWKSLQAGAYLPNEAVGLNVPGFLAIYPELIVVEHSRTELAIYRKGDQPTRESRLQSVAAAAYPKRPAKAATAHCETPDDFKLLLSARRLFTIPVEVTGISFESAFAYLSPYPEIEPMPLDANNPDAGIVLL
jgi:hypothetical protein